MRINNNLMAINTHRQMGIVDNAIGKAMERLSSGLRINRGSDDAAGLAISEKMRAQIRGLNQASRNAQDAISLIQTAEGALSETQAILQRMRELSVQSSNDTYVERDREEIQKEINQLTEEIDRIANTTEFNTIQLLNREVKVEESSPSANLTEEEIIISNLKKWWLAEAEKLVKEGYGIESQNIDMEVIMFDDPDHPAAALVRAEFTVDGTNNVGTPGLTGGGSNLTLEINLAHSRPVDENTDGGSPPQYVSRVMAHEMVHAVMMTTMNFQDLGIWFNEGTAEFIHGADERLMNNIYANSGAISVPMSEAEKNTGLQAVIDAIGNGNDSDWNSTSLDYSAAYVAVRYLDWQIRQDDHMVNPNAGIAGDSDGIKVLMKYLADDDSRTIDDGLTHLHQEGLISFNNHSGWIDAFKTDVDHFDALETHTGIQLDFNVVDGRFVAEDTGSIFGSSITGDEHLTEEAILPQAGGVDAPELEQPLLGFNIIWPEGMETDEEEADDGAKKEAALVFQIGANAGQSMKIELANMTAEALGITKDGDTLDITDHQKASQVISIVDNAIELVSGERSKLGAFQNRLEHTIANLDNASENLLAAESRIRDVDMAKTMMELARQNILKQASMAMLSQANQRPRTVLQLLS
ncbi:flagellinolysin [Tindallia californiensis]|uniref:Flagellin n=1 Tax=Tindallia californiensis TaxID=159292 RepID=A0A1H3LBS7_9FIRM|nr:flagellinolysin [Tindallia californiensis]SDY61893.1 flagellin [Tindallia californiensis]